MLQNQAKLRKTHVLHRKQKTVKENQSFAIENQQQAKENQRFAIENKKS